MIMSSPQAPAVVDLFCGAGGLALGFSRAGFEVRQAVDHFGAAVETYRANIGNHVSQAPITERSEISKADIIVGGPPCQGFSSAGQRRAGDKRNTLVSVFAQLVAAHRPRAFVFENVEGFLTAEGGARVIDLLSPLIAVGYRIHLRKVNVANYGIPQHRKRVLAIGGLGWEPSFPEPTHSAYGAPGAELAGKHLPQTATLQDALMGLPEPAVAPPGTPQGHFSTIPDVDDLERIRALAPGQTMRDLPKRLWHVSYKRRAFRRVMDGIPTERRGGAPAGKRRLRSDEPSKAITGGARGEFVHPTEDRYLTLRECARVQTFPDDFVFLGSIQEQSVLIGNAVPPAFAEAIALTLFKDLSLEPSGRKEGALLSFVPTVSLGMSPALQEISRIVGERFLGRNRPEQINIAWD